MNFLYFFDVWAGDPTQTLATRGEHGDVTTCSNLHLQPLQPALTCILFETKAFARDPHVPWSAFVWQLDETLVDFFKCGDVDCSFLSVSSRKLAFDSPSLKHGHDS